MNEKDREELLLALTLKYKHQPSSTFVVKPAVTHKVKQKAIPKIDVSKRRDPNATVSQDNRDRDYVAQQRAQRLWDATIAKAKSDYAMDNALLKTSNIQPINGQYSPEVGDFAGWETVGAIAGGTDPLNFIPFGKIARGIKARRLAKTIDAVVDDGVVGATKEMPVVRPEDVVNPEHFRYAHSNNPSQPKLEILLPKLNVKQLKKLYGPAKLNTAPQDAGLYDIANEDQFNVRLVDAALRPYQKVSPQDIDSDIMHHLVGRGANRIANDVYDLWRQNQFLWEAAGIKPPVPFIPSVGDDQISIGFTGPWYKMIQTPSNLERMSGFAAPNEKKLLAGLSEEARFAYEHRNNFPVDLFDEFLGPEAMSPQQRAVEEELINFDTNLKNRWVFNSNVADLYRSGLITPRHRSVLINSEDPLKYFNEGALHNIMKKAVQNYFKDIKTVKQKDYARRVMSARELEQRINKDLNSSVEPAYKNIQETIQPPFSLNRLVINAQNLIEQIGSIKDIINKTVEDYLGWKRDPNRSGWQLKPLMAGSKFEKQLSKDGTISVSNLYNGMKSASDVEKYTLEKVLSEKFAGQTRVNYADLKHAVLEELPVYQHINTHNWEDYGINALGYGKSDAGLNLDAYTFSTPSIRNGNAKHFNRSDALGHSRTMVLKDEPDTQYVLESQSDWGQNFNTSHPSTPHERYLAKNFESRLIQENMLHAHKKGLTKMRYPTRETAAKIEGYTKRPWAIDEQGNDINPNDFFNFERSRQNPNAPEETLFDFPEGRGGFAYRSEHETILKKYDAFPKQFRKLYKGAEVRTVTDKNGNTWYEVDVPKDLSKRERAYGITGTIVAGGTAASTLKPRKKQ